MNHTRFATICAALMLAACASTPEAPPPPPPPVGGFTPTGNPVMDAALMAAAQAAAQSATAPAPQPAPEYLPPTDAAPGAVDPATGMAKPYDPAAGAVAAAAPAGSETPYAGGSLPPGTIGVFNEKPLVPAVQSGDVKIECYYSSFPPDGSFIPMEVKVTPLARLDNLTVKVDPEDGVVMRDGPQTKSIATPSDPYFRRIFAMRATDRDSYLRVSTLTKTSSGESRRSVLCPLARLDKVPDTGH
ncbi:MAG: hypothetical protein AABY95_09845 [Pseudomonadota bacterium]